MIAELAQWLTATPAAWMLLLAYIFLAGAVMCLGNALGQVVTVIGGGFLLAFGLDHVLVAWAAALAGLAFHVSGFAVVAYFNEGLRP